MYSLIFAMHVYIFSMHICYTCVHICLHLTLLNEGSSTHCCYPSLSDHDSKASPNVFTEVLSPRCLPGGGGAASRSLQVQINVFLSPTDIKASILLNKVRLIGIFDLILELKSFVFEKQPEDTDG